ncbi:hypothetical protein ACP70R_028847 [Stipagrostis hirtigluma subsp. patula]
MLRTRRGGFLGGKPARPNGPNATASWLGCAFGKFKKSFGHRNAATRKQHSTPLNSPLMAAPAAGDPSPPPGGWLSGLVSGAGRLLAAVLGSESSGSDSASSSPESSQPPDAADLGSGAHFASNNYQLNKSGKEIVLKDSGEGSLALVSEMDPKDAVMQLLMQETYTRSECDALIKIIQERVMDSDPDVDEPADVLPLAWAPGTEQDDVSYSSLCPNNSPHATSVSLVLKRSYSNRGDALEESRRVRPKLNGLNISEKVVDVHRNHAGANSFENSTTIDRNASRGIPEDDMMLFADIPLLGTDNLTVSKIASRDVTAFTVQHLASSSYEANRDLMETFPVKVEPFEDLVPCEPEMVDLAQKNHHTRTICNDFGSLSKLMFQQDIEAAPRVENNSRSHNKGFNVQRIPNKTGSPAKSNLRPKNRNTTKSRNKPLQQSNAASVGHKMDAGHIQAKRPVGRPKKAR